MKQLGKIKQQKSKIIRMTTVPISMNIILKGQLGYINRFFEVVGVTGRDGNHYNAISKQEGIRMEAITMTRTISITKDIIALLRLIRLFKSEHPVIVHTHTPKAGLLGMVAAWIVGVPIRLHTVGGMPLIGKTGWKKRLLLFTERLTYTLSHKVYPNSTGLAEILVHENLVSKEKLKVMGKGSSNGVNVQHFHVDAIEADKRTLRKEWGIPEDATVFLFVGRLAKEKGIEELVEAFRLIYKKNSTSCLVLIGPYEKDHGSLNTTVKRQIEEHQGIYYLGRFDDVRPFYKLSDVFVFPSYREGFPNALMEACAMGLPCIATDINGCNEIIHSGENGILIPPKEMDLLYAAMVKLKEVESIRQDYGKRAREYVEQNFRNEYIWSLWKAEYDHWIEVKSLL